jgi:hypothetical protein
MEFDMIFIGFLLLIVKWVLRLTCIWKSWVRALQETSPPFFFLKNYESYKIFGCQTIVVMTIMVILYNQSNQSLEIPKHVRFINL